MMPSLRTQYWSGHPARVWLYIGLTGVAVYGASLPVILFRPTGLDWAIWWPAAGLAVGLLLWAPRRFTPILLATVTIAFVLAQLSAGRAVSLAIALGLAAALETLVAHTLIRGSREELPRLVKVRDLAFLLGGSVAAVGALAVMSSTTVGVLVGVDVIPVYLQVTVLAHLAGLLVVTPLFFDLGSGRHAERRLELLAQWLSVFGTLAIIWWAAQNGLPLAFLLLGPLVWGAARLGGRQLVAQVIIVLSLAGEIRGGDGGLFAVAGIPAETSAVMLQLFMLSTAVVVYSALAVATSNARVLRLSTAAIDASITGFAELRKRGEECSVIAVNDAARMVLGQTEVPLRAAFNEDSAAELQATAARVNSAGDSLGGVERVTTLTGRVLQASISPLLDPNETRRDVIGQHYSLQFIDITDSLLVAQAEELERRRAADIQRALLPVDPPAIVGWQLAGRCRPSRDVGGDFYSWSTAGQQMSITLGDVMGKGLGAGVMAASIQMAVTLQDPVLAPGDVVGRVASAIGAELERAATFATLFHAQIDAETGEIRFADAGHGLTVVVTADGGHRRLHGGGLPLGIDGTATWASNNDQIHPGDVLLVMSDGVLDAFATVDEAWREVSAIVAREPNADAAVEALTRLGDYPGVADDVTVLVCRRESLPVL